MKVLHALEHYNKLCYFQLYVGISKKITNSILNFVTIIWVMHKWKVGYFLKFEFTCLVVNISWRLKYNTQVQKIYVHYEISYRHVQNLYGETLLFNNVQKCLKQKKRKKDDTCEVVYFRHQHHPFHDLDSISMLSFSLGNMLMCEKVTMREHHSNCVHHKFVLGESM